MMRICPSASPLSVASTLLAAPALCGACVFFIPSFVFGNITCAVNIDIATGRHASVSKASRERHTSVARASHERHTSVARASHERRTSVARASHERRTSVTRASHERRRHPHLRHEQTPAARRRRTSVPRASRERHTSVTRASQKRHTSVGTTLISALLLRS
eukprot:490724-Prorocentrum_minimum.AAC.1